MEFYGSNLLAIFHFDFAFILSQAYMPEILKTLKKIKNKL